MNKPSRVKFSENRQHLRNSPVRPLAGGRNPPPLLLRPARTATCRLLFPLAILETRCLKALRGGILMNAAERLCEQYQRELKQLQEICPHEQLTDWMEEWWAPGHSTGRKVKACANCNKIIQATRRCQVCLGEFPEYVLKEGDGRSLPIGVRYCETCFRRELSKGASGVI